jgi:hypothetical protein
MRTKFRSRKINGFGCAKLGIWTPDEGIFGNQRAYGFVRDYLMNVGNMLYDGHLSDAKQYAERKMTESPSNFHV